MNKPIQGKHDFLEEVLFDTLSSKQVNLPAAALVRVRRRAGEEEDDAANRIDVAGGGLGALAEEKAALEAREGLADRAEGQQQQKGRDIPNLQLKPKNNNCFRFRPRAVEEVEEEEGLG